MMIRYLKFSELQAKLGNRSRSSIYRDIENARLPNPIRIGASLYWNEQELDDFLRTRGFSDS